MGKNRILIVDDDESIVRVLSSLMADKGLQVDTASDGKEGSSLLKSGVYPVALIDINLPGKNGLKVLSDVKKAGVEASIIIMTAEQTMTNTLEAMKRGAFDYISKPFDLDELEIIIDRAVENIKLKREVTKLKDRLTEKAHERGYLYREEQADTERIQDYWKGRGTRRYRAPYRRVPEQERNCSVKSSTQIALGAKGLS